MDGWMDGRKDEVLGLWWDSHEILVWAAGQPWGSKWWSPWVEAQVTWLQGAPPSFTLFPLLLLICFANFAELYQFPLFFRHIELLNEFVGLAINLTNEVLSPVMHYEVNPPLLGLQSQAWWGQRWPSLCRLYSLDTFLSGGPTSFWAVSCYLSPFVQPDLGRRWAGAQHKLKSLGPTLEPFIIPMDGQ